MELETAGKPLLQTAGKVLPEPARTRRRGVLSLRRLPRRRSASITPPAIEESGVATAPVVDKRDQLYRRMLAYADMAAAALATLLTLTVIGDDTPRLATILILPIVVAVSKIHGLYDRDELLIRKTTVDEAPQLFQQATFYTLVVWLLDGVLIDGYLSPEQVVLLWGSFFTLTFGARLLARRAAQKASPAERCLFVGGSDSYARLRTKLESEGANATLVGRMSLQRPARGVERSADENELREIIAWTDAHRVIIDSHVLPPAEGLELIRAAKSVGVRVSLLPRVLDVVGTSVVFDDLSGMAILGVRRFGLSRSSMLVKRAFDIAGAGLGLLIAAPAMLVISVAIKFDSPGPVLFRQTRVGRDGRRFKICKFRTMVADADELKDELRTLNEVDGGLFKIEEDPRITRIGRLLRKSSLDELPQLLNVLRGDMSLVGPRPLVVDEDEQIKGYDRRRLQLTPGMTGHWQILGSSRVPLPEMVKIDYRYVASWSLWNDMKILLRTVPYMLSRRGM